MDQAEKFDLLPPQVATVTREIAQRHVSPPSQGLYNLGPLAALARYRLQEVLGEQPDEAQLSTLHIECIRHLQEQRIPHKLEHNSHLAAVRKIDTDLRDRLTGMKHELLQQDDPPKFDLAKEA